MFEKVFSLLSENTAVASFSAEKISKKKSFYFLVNLYLGTKKIVLKVHKRYILWTNGIKSKFILNLSALEKLLNKFAEQTPLLKAGN